MTLIHSVRPTIHRPRVLVACERTGTVRDAFTALGWDAWSADLEASWTPGQHYEGDARDLLGHQWDLMIAHPPCTYLSNAGVSWLNRIEGRREQMRDGAAFFREFLDADHIPARAVENPKPHGEALALIGRPTQYVNPNEYGAPESKRTGLWLRGLPPLLAGVEGVPKTGQPDYVSRLSSSDWRRSATWPGLAQAMADQWSEFLAVAA